MQGIADSLDLGLEVEEGRMKVEEEYDGADRGMGEPNMLVVKGDIRLVRRRESVGMGDLRVERRRESVGVRDVRVERRRESAGAGEVRVERRRESVAVVLPVANRRSVG